MEISGAATPEFCEMMIEKFEADERKKPALIGPKAEEIKTIRDSTNLEINHFVDWKSVVDDLRGMIYSRLCKYLDDIHIGATKSMWCGGYDSTYTMMKYVPGTIGYDWHNDFSYDTHTDRGGIRTVTWLFYLNECDGGETEFITGKKIKPEAGKLVLFPSTWCMVHRGLPINSGVKYLCVGWLMSTWDKGAK